MRISLLAITMMLCFALNAKTFIREYTYRAGEADSKITARAIALEQTKRLLLEEVGVYIQSSILLKETETNGEVNSLTEQEIQVLSAGITQTKVLAETWNGETYTLKAHISLDEKDVLSRLDDLINNTKDKEMLQQNRLITDTALQEMERLKKELEQEKDKNLQLQLQQEYAAEAGKLSAVEYFEIGSELTSHDEDNFMEAKQWFGKAVEADSTFAEAWFSLGQCHFFTDDYGQARFCLNKSYSLNNDSMALLWLGHCYSGLKDYSTALSYYHQAYNESQNLEYLAEVAESYHRMDRDDEAKRIYLQILALDPDNFTATNYISLVYLNLQEYDNAIACYFKLIEMEADPASMYGSIASAYSAKGDFAKARDFYLMALSLEPEASYNWSYLATASYNIGDYAQTVTALLKVLTFYVDDPWALNLLACSYENLSDVPNSQKYHILAARQGHEESIAWCREQSIDWQ